MRSKMKTPKHRNIIHRHARLRSGAGVHKDKRQDVMTAQELDDAWTAADYARHGTPETFFTPEDNMEMSLKEFREEHCIYDGTDMQDAVKGWQEDETAPAMCRNGCEVPHDGKCVHGCPSILLKLGVN